MATIEHLAKFVQFIVHLHAENLSNRKRKKKNENKEEEEELHRFSSPNRMPLCEILRSSLLYSPVV